MADIGAVGGIEVIDDLKRIAELSAPGGLPPGGETGAERHELISSLGERLTGSRVEIVEFHEAREAGDRSITAYGLANGAQMARLADTARAEGRRRHHPVTGREYDIHDFFRHPEHVRGVVEGIDSIDGKLVVNPWLLGITGIKSLMTRDWIQIFSAEGKQLAELSVV